MQIMLRTLVVVGVLFSPEVATPGPEGSGVLPSIQEADFPGSFPLAGTDIRLKIGGFVRLDIIHDFSAMGSTDSFDPSTIPTDGTKGENTRVHARGTRLNLDTRGPSTAGILRAFVEGDFYGSGNSFRLRHGFGEIKGLLAGQTWTTFMDDEAIPPTLDSEEPRTMIFHRLGVLRWTQQLNEHSLVSFALEDAGGTISTPPSSSGSTETPWPNVVGRGRVNDTWGHAQVTGFLGSVRYRDDSEPADSILLWGLSASGKIHTTKKNEMIFQAAYGEGLGQFRGGAVAALSTSGEFQAIPNRSVTYSFLHRWSNALSSHAIVNHGWNETLDGQASTALEATWYGALNTVWSFADRATIGAEWLYGQREDRDGARGHNNRFLIATTFVIS